MCSHRQDDLSVFHKELITYGYTRMHCHSEQLIPNELSNLCLQYFDELMRWNLTEDDIQRFISATKKQKFCSMPVKYRNTAAEIKWNIAIYPIGEVEGNDNYSKLFVEIPEFANVASITAACQLCLWIGNECKHDFKFCHIFRWRSPTMGSVAFKHDLLKQTNDKNVTITCYFDIIHVQFDNLFAVQKYFIAPKTIKLYKKESFQWQINEELLCLFKSDPFRMWQSESFGVSGNWCLEIMPNSTLTRNKEDAVGNNNNVSIGFDLLRLPNEIRTVNIEYEISIESNLDSRRFQEIVDVNHTDSEYVWPEDLYQTEQLFNSSSVIICININVLEIFDYSDKQIEKNINVWNKYGVV